MTLCNKSFENAGWDVFPLLRCSSTWGCYGFRSPFHPFRCWRSVLEVCPGEVKGPLWLNPPWCFCSSATSARGSGAAPAASLAGSWDHQEFSLQTILLWALLQKPFWVHDVCVTPAGLCSRVQVTPVHQVSVSPDFCYTGLESSWEVFPACAVACGVFLHWLFHVEARAVMELSWQKVIVASQAHEKAQIALKMHFGNGLQSKNL